jgi:hypothetical protein
MSEAISPGLFRKLGPDGVAAVPSCNCIPFGAPCAFAPRYAQSLSQVAIIRNPADGFPYDDQFLVLIITVARVFARRSRGWQA